MFNETNIFELLNDKYVLPKKVKLFESFAGIGCQRLAFNRLGIEVEMVGISEIDKYAIQSYNAIHGDTKNWGSICDIKGQDLPQIDVFTYSFPCTDLSRAGSMKGLSKDTRSGLVYQVLRILQELKLVDRLPKCLIMENVVDLVQVKFVRQFQEIQLELEGLGYKNYAQTLNAKNYGIPQNRDRIFMVSVLGEKYYEFPKPIKLEKRLKDYLDNNVEEKYYLTDSFIAAMNKDGGKFNRSERFEQSTHKDVENAISFTITSRAGGRPTDNFIQIQEATEKGYSEAYEGDIINLSQPNSKTRLGRVGEQMAQTLTTQNSIAVVEPIIYDDYNQSIRADQDTIGTLTTNCGNDAERNGYKLIEIYKNDVGVIIEDLIIGSGQKNAFQGSVDGVCSALTSAMGMGGGQTPMVTEKNRLRIRKLTPRECWRLMGIYDSDFDNASQVVSNSQLYKQAGNGIVVDVFAAILKQMVV